MQVAPEFVSAGKTGILADGAFKLFFGLVEQSHGQLGPGRGAHQVGVFGKPVQAFQGDIERRSGISLAKGGLGLGEQLALCFERGNRKPPVASRIKPPDGGERGL